MLRPSSLALCLLSCVFSAHASPFLSKSLLKGELPNCDIYRENQCSGNQIEADVSLENHLWYTPEDGEQNYQQSYQSYSRLVAYTSIAYNNDRTAATVEVRAKHRDSATALTFVFDGEEQPSNKKQFTSAFDKVLRVQVKAADGASIELEEVDFVWNAPKVKFEQRFGGRGDYRGGQKGAIVELFAWPHSDVEQECKRIAELGYLGVKVFPIVEQVMSDQPFNGALNPWYFMYQPVSYRLSGRMGSRAALRSMIRTCRSYGLNVYADAVVNHMTGNGNDANPFHRNPQAGCTKWGAKGSSLSLTAEGNDVNSADFSYSRGNSPFYTQGYAYTSNERTGQAPSQEFPAVPYGPTDFRCERSLNSWTDPLVLNAGWLSGLTDLNTGKEEVQERIAAHLTDLLSIGFSGFRVDAAKHIRPADLADILAKLARNMGGALPGDFITWLEVILGGETDLLMGNPNSGYNYGAGLTELLQKAGLSSGDISKVKVWNSGYPKETDNGVRTISKWRSAIQVDDADQQMPGSTSRDMGDKGCVLVKGCDKNTHRAFSQQLFLDPPGASDNNNEFPIRLVLSSYYFPNGDVMGLPDGHSDCARCKVGCDSCKSVPFVKAFKAESTGYDGQVGQVEYTRVHRDAGIVSAMRQWMGLPSLGASELADSNNTLGSTEANTHHEIIVA